MKKNNQKRNNLVIGEDNMDDETKKVRIKRKRYTIPIEWKDKDGE